jgi:sensor histidine kinase regulating citrate/malate metabolism
MDLTTIVSNILDNALEAVDELPEENRKILFIIEEKMGCILFHSENAYAKLNETANKKYVSTKEGHMGVGLVNIESSVKQYDGIFTIDVQNKKFVVLITIPRK